MKISYDPTKREKILIERGLDFEDSIHVFKHIIFEYEDIRKDYGEKRMLCYGLLKEIMILVGYVQRDDIRHIFTMRNVHEKETKKIYQRTQEKEKIWQRLH